MLQIQNIDRFLQSLEWQNNFPRKKKIKTLQWQKKEDKPIQWQKNAAAGHPRFRKKSCYSTAPEIIATVTYRPCIIKRSSSCSHGQSSCPPAQSVDMWAFEYGCPEGGPGLGWPEAGTTRYVLGIGHGGHYPTRTSWPSLRSTQTGPPLRGGHTHRPPTCQQIGMRAAQAVSTT